MQEASSSHCTVSPLPTHLTSPAVRALVPDAHRGEHHQPPPEAVHQSELSIAATNHSPVLPVGEAPAAVGVPLGEVDQAAMSGGVTGINKDMQASFDDL